MRASFTVQTKFSASHQVTGHPTCGRLHGHRWGVQATIEGPISPRTGYISDSPEFVDAVAAVRNELNNRDLNAMLPGVVPVPEGIASWFRERLLLQFPNITRVVVKMDDVMADLEWPLR